MEIFTKGREIKFNTTINALFYFQAEQLITTDLS